MKRFLVLLSALVLIVPSGRANLAVTSMKESPVAVELYQVGDTDGSERRLADDFAGITIPDGRQSKEMKDAAQAVYDRVRGLNKKPYASVSLKDGRAEFKDLPYGIYLAASERQKQGDKVYEAVPVLVFLDQNGDPDFHIELKTEVEELHPEATITVSVEKKWKLRAGDKSVPITVTLLRDGMVTDEVKLNDGNGWSYSWTGLDPDSVWSVRELNVPEGFLAEVSEMGNYTVITNTSIEYLKATPQTGIGGIPADVVALGCLMGAAALLLTHIIKKARRP